MKNLTILTIALLVGANVLECRAAPETNAPAILKDKAFRDLFTALFSAWNVSHDGKLTLAELNTLIKNPHVSGNASAIAVVFRDHCTNWLSLAQVQSLASNKTVQASVSDAAWNIQKAKRALFLNGEPSIFNVRQGSLGDCYFLAPLAALLYHDPEAVRAMIEPSNNGQFLVHFANGIDVIVDPLTDAELQLNDVDENGEMHGLWLPILEKAYAKTRNGGNQSVYTDVIGSGGCSVREMKFLAGRGIMGTWAGDEKALAGLAGDGWMMTVSTADRKTPPGIPDHHAIAVLSFDAVDRLVLLFNPWGNDFTPKGSPGLANGYLTRHGFFKMPIEDFKHTFFLLNYIDKYSFDPSKPRQLR